MSEEKELYRILAQRDGLTITVEMREEHTFDELKERVLCEEIFNVTLDKCQPFVIQPLTTKERWEEQCINFCPRCGVNITTYEIEQNGEFECHSCDTHVEIYTF